MVMMRKGRVNGEVKGQGLERGKAGMQGLPPGVLFGKEVELEVGVGEVSSDRAVWKPESCILTQRKACVSVALHTADM